MTSEPESPALKQLREDQLERVRDGSFLEAPRAVPSVELAQIKAKLKDPNAVYLALLRNDIARPTITQIEHIYAASVSDILKHSTSVSAKFAHTEKDLEAENKRLLIEREIDGYIEHFRTQDRIASVQVTKALSELKRRLLTASPLAPEGGKND